LIRKYARQIHQRSESTKTVCPCGEAAAKSRLKSALKVLARFWACQPLRRR
jgi:hypothetical protein